MSRPPEAFTRNASDSFDGPGFRGQMKVGRYETAMSKGRMEAFSDGVLAIIITIMVLGLTPPRGPDPVGLLDVMPTLISYVLSFVLLGIYWNNHHHLLQAVKQVDGRVLWSNLHLLFWLSLIPFTTAWMGRNNFAAWPVAIYGLVLTLAAVAYFLLTQSLIALHGAGSTIAAAVGRDIKGRTSLAIYVAAVLLAFVNARLAFGMYVLVAVLWFVPDRRIERALGR